MATRRWCGRSEAVAQVSTYTVGGTWAAGQVYEVTANTRTVAYETVTADVDNDGAATGLQAALAASDYPEFREVTWTVDGAVVTGTAATPGKPFVATSTADGTGTLTAATPTASSGPNYWSVADNWREGAVPTTGDDVIIDEGPSILYGLDQNGETLASLRVTQNYPAASQIGLPNQTNPANPASGYAEYRDRRLKIGATLVTIDTVSRRVRLDLDTDATTVTVNGTGQPLVAGEYALDIVGVNNANVLRVNRGSVGLGYQAGDAATFTSVQVSYQNNPAGDATVRVGRGVTLTTLTQAAGDVVLECAATTVNKTGGTLTRVGTGAVTTLRNRGGRVNDDGTGTITALYNTGEYYLRGLAALTVTDATLYRGSVTDDRNGRVTWTNAPNLFECHPAGPPADPGPAPCYFNFGIHKKITIAAI